MEVQKPEVEGKETASEWAWNRPEPKDQMSEELIHLKLCLEMLSSGGLFSGREVLWCKPDSGGDDTFLFTTWRQVSS
jgi:hypothetical protein